MAKVRRLCGAMTCQLYRFLFHGYGWFAGSLGAVAALSLWPVGRCRGMRRLALLSMSLCPLSLSLALFLSLSRGSCSSSAFSFALLLSRVLSLASFLRWRCARRRTEKRTNFGTGTVW